MQRLTGMDSMFVSLESPTNLFHVGAVAVLDPSTAPLGSPPPHESLRRVVENRLDRIPPFRRRLVQVPLGIDHPRWVEDQVPDLDRHIRRGAVPVPGGTRELAQYTADVLSHPIDRDRPLWEIHVVEGLEGGLVAGIAKIHHSAVDGIAGTEVTGQLMDIAPEVPPDRELCTPESSGLESPPGLVSLLREALASAGRRAVPTVKSLARLAGAASTIRSRNREWDSLAPPSPFMTPRTCLSAKVGSQRVVGMAHVEMEDVRRVREMTGVTINDVVLTLSASVLREYFEERCETPPVPLVSFVPVSVRNAHDTLATGVNRLSGMLVSLATNVADPVVRLLAVSESARSAKAQDRILGPDMFSSFAELAVPALLRPAGRAARAAGLTTRRPPFSVVISSFPGPRLPLYCGGAEMLAYHPFGPIIDGAALNITAMSYKDQIGFGLLACRDAVPDIDVIAGKIPEAMTELTKAVEAQSRIGHNRRGTGRSNNGRRSGLARDPGNGIDRSRAGKPPTSKTRTALTRERTGASQADKQARSDQS